MKKNLLIIRPLVVLILVAAVTFLFFYSLRQVNWWADLSVTPVTYGSEWTSEDGSLVFSTSERYDSFQQTLSEGHTVTVAGGDITAGSLTIGEDNIPVYIQLGTDGSFSIWLNDKPYLPNKVFQELERWNATECKENAEEIVVYLEVDKTTYYTKGQKIKLIYKKNK